jgi:hypothetical protein
VVVLFPPLAFCFLQSKVSAISFTKTNPNDMRNIVLGLALSAITITTKAQVAINTSGSNAASSAMLDVSSTSKGILISRMTGAQRKAIPNPETGLLVFDLDRSTIFMYDGAQWRPLTFSSEKKLPLVEREPDTDDNSVKLGNDVGMSGDYAIAGAPSEDSAGLFSIGAAYIYIIVRMEFGNCSRNYSLQITSLHNSAPA